MEDEKVEIEVPVIESNNRPSSKTHRRKSSEETKFENQRRGSFVYEQISDKNKTQMMKKQFSKKATVKVTTRCDCILEQGKTVQINEYYLLKTLGKGAYGEVKLATKDLMEDDFGSKHEKYAIKMMKREAVSDDKKRFAARRSSGATSVPSENTSMSEDDEETRALKNIPESMLQEIAIMKMLVHPNLVNLLEIINDEDSKFVYLVLEHVEGGTIMGLDESTGLYVYRLTGRVMGEGTASRTFKDLISALSYLHANHIAHRDIKPDNLLVDFTGKLKLSDFGVSSHFENDRKKSSISLVALARSKSRGSVSKTEGTYSFYSPEMCTVKTVQGYSAYMADVWAATVCLWIFIFGRVPFYHPEVMTLFQMIRESDPVIPHPVSPELDDLFKSCLQKDVTLRPSAAHVRHHCWLTHEPLADYLKAQVGEDSGDDENEATKLLETDDIDIICDPTPPKRDYIPLYMVKKLKKIAARAREKCESRRDEYIHKANVEMNLLVRKAQRCRNTLNEEDEDEDSLDDLSVDSDDSDPLGRVVSFMDFDSSPPRDQNINSRRVLELSSDDGDSDPNSTPKRKQSMGSNKKSLTKLPIDEPDDENNDENDDEENNEKSLFQKYFFCCM